MSMNTKVNFTFTFIIHMHFKDFIQKSCIIFKNNEKLLYKKVLDMYLWSTWKFKYFWNVFEYKYKYFCLLKNVLEYKYKYLEMYLSQVQVQVQVLFGTTLIHTHLDCHCTSFYCWNLCLGMLFSLSVLNCLHVFTWDMKWFCLQSNINL